MLWWGNHFCPHAAFSSKEELIKFNIQDKWNSQWTLYDSFIWKAPYCWIVTLRVSGGNMVGVHVHFPSCDTHALIRPQSSLTLSSPATSSHTPSVHLGWTWILLPLCHYEDSSSVWDVLLRDLTCTHLPLRNSFWTSVSFLMPCLNFLPFLCSLSYILVGFSIFFTDAVILCSIIVSWISVSLCEPVCSLEGSTGS